MENLVEYVQNRKKTHLIFDFDETIFMLHLPWERCAFRAEKQLRELDNPLIDRQDFHTWEQIQNAYVEKFGQKALDIILPNNVLFETEMLEGFGVNESLVEWIRNAKGYTMSIWSSNTTPVIESILRKYGLKEKFEHIITRNSVTFLKPNPEGFEKIYSSDISKDKYVMVGDSSADKDAAAACGIDFFHVTYF